MDESKNLQQADVKHIASVQSEFDNPRQIITPLKKDKYLSALDEYARLYGQLKKENEKDRVNEIAESNYHYNMEKNKYNVVVKDSSEVNDFIAMKTGLVGY